MSKLWLVIIFITALVFMSFLTTRDTKKKVIFFGDSITQAAVQPHGYITVMQEMLQQQNISNYDLIGAGIGGNKVYDLYLRMDSDVLTKSPDIVVIYIGVNDVWHKVSSGTGTDPDKFEKFYNAIIKKLKQRNISVVLCTPAVIGEKTDFTNQQDGDLNKYAAIIRGIAKQNNLALVDLRQKFLDYNRQYNTENKEQGILTRDRVHLNAIGNQLVADEMWKIISGL